MELGKTKGLDLPVAHETEKKILFLLLSERKDPAPIQYLLSALKDEDFFIPVHLQAFKLIKNYITEHGLISDLGLFLDWLQTQCRDKAQYVKLMAEISKILDTQYEAGGEGNISSSVVYQGLARQHLLSKLHYHKHSMAMKFCSSQSK